MGGAVQPVLSMERGTLNGDDDDDDDDEPSSHGREECCPKVASITKI